VTAVLAALLGLGLPVPIPNASAQTSADKSDVVLVLDFSASILQEPTTRNRFGAALERIADRVEELSSELTAGDTAITLVQFATRAVDYPTCTDIRLHENPAGVTKFANCLRSVASAYRKGLTPALSRRIGVDTNYVAAMQRAAAHLPATAVRPALIMFTDGRHDVKGVPASQVKVVRDRLFGARSPFALLPVGMGLDPGQRDALEAGLVNLRIVKDMPPCVTGQTFDWPTVVFDSADEAGNAVAVALQDVTCTFTVAPTPTPTPVPKPGPVRNIQLIARDGAIDLSWAAPAGKVVPVVGYRARCRAGEGDWVEPAEGQSKDTKATIEGLTNGLDYTCEVAAIGARSEGAFTAATAVATPLGKPAPPAKPAVEALDHGIRISVGAADPAGISGYHYECSDNGGGSFGDGVDVEGSASTAQIPNLTNGVSYVCRAFAINATGRSQASALSDGVTPCGSFLECNSLLTPLLVILGVVLVGGLLAAFVALYRERERGYVVAVVDVVHVANLGAGSRLGISFVTDPGTRRVTGIVPDRGRKPDVRIRRLRGGRFAVTDTVRRQVTTSGEAMTITAVGRHSLVLEAFETSTASAASHRA
jgi:hypothetical protein